VRGLETLLAGALGLSTFFGTAQAQNSFAPTHTPAPSVEVVRQSRPELNLEKAKKMMRKIKDQEGNQFFTNIQIDDYLSNANTPEKLAQKIERADLLANKKDGAKKRIFGNLDVLFLDRWNIPDNISLMLAGVEDRKGNAILRGAVAYHVMNNSGLKYPRMLAEFTNEKGIAKYIGEPAARISALHITKEELTGNHPIDRPRIGITYPANGGIFPDYNPNTKLNSVKVNRTFDTIENRKNMLDVIRQDYNLDASLVSIDKDVYKAIERAAAANVEYFFIVGHRMGDAILLNPALEAAVTDYNQILSAEHAGIFSSQFPPSRQIPSRFPIEERSEQRGLPSRIPEEYLLDKSDVREFRKAARKLNPNTKIVFIICGAAAPGKDNLMGFLQEVFEEKELIAATESFGPQHIRTQRNPLKISFIKDERDITYRSLKQEYGHSTSYLSSTSGKD
jgi:hypothetical protein